MTGTLDADVRYRWTIQTGPHHGSIVEGGGDSPGVLGDCFAMWAQNSGDLSDWEDAPELGAIVVRHGDLSCQVVAVWLGIEPGAIRAVGNPALDPPWHLTAPDGNRLTVDRQIVDRHGPGPD